MGRSLKKGPYVDAKLLKKIEKLEIARRKDPIKTWGASVDDCTGIHRSYLSGPQRSDAH